MKQYKTKKDIEVELKLLDLERKIAWEELKLLKNDLDNTLQPLFVIKNVFYFISKLSIVFFLKKMINKKNK